MAFPNSIESRRMPADIAAFGLGEAPRPPVTKPVKPPPVEPTEPIVETRLSIAKGEPIPPGGEIIIRRLDGSVTVVYPADPDDNLRQAIETPKLVREPYQQSTENPFVNLGRYIRDLSNRYLPTAVNGRWVRRR